MSNVLNLNANIVSTARIDLSWLLGSYDDDGMGNPVFVAQTPAPAYRIRRTTNEDLTENAVVFNHNSSVQAFSDTTVTPGNVYYYQVEEADSPGVFTAGYSDAIEVFSYAANVTIVEKSFPNWKFGGTTAKLRIFANKAFQGVDGTLVHKGNAASGWFKEIVCNIVGTSVIVPEIVLPSTLGSDKPDATYSAVFVDYRRVIRREFLGMKKFKLSGNAAVTSWSLIRTENLSVQLAQPNTYSTSAQVLTMIQNFFADVVVVIGDATAAIKGKVILDTEPDDEPIVPGINSPLFDAATTDDLGRVKFTKAGTDKAVSANEPSFVDASKEKYYDDYTGTFANRVASFVTAVPSALKRFIFTSALSVAASTTTPANAQFTRRGDGLISVEVGQTLTINNLDDPGEVQIFNPASLGTVVVKNHRLRMAWYKSLASSDVTSAFAKMRASTVANKGGEIELSKGEIINTAGNAALVSNTTIRGAGNAFDEANTGTKYTLTQDGDALYRVGGNTRNVQFEDHQINMAGTSNCIGIILEGAQGDSSFAVGGKNLVFNGGAIGIQHNSLSGAWQMEQSVWRECKWILTGKAFNCDSPNSSYDFVNPYISLGSGRTAFDLDAVGVLNVRGGGANILGGGFGSGSVAIHTKGEHLEITASYQSEGVDYELINDVAFVNKAITYENGLYQGRFLLNKSCFLRLLNCNLTAECISDLPAGDSVSQVVIDGCTFSPHINDPQNLAVTSEVSNGVKESVGRGAARTVTFTVDVATDIFTSAAHGFQTGSRVTVSSTVAVPAGLAGATNYWVIRLSANTFKLATSLANAAATVPVPINITTTGTGTHSATMPRARFWKTKNYSISSETNTVTFQDWLGHDVAFREQSIVQFGNLDRPRVSFGSNEPDKVLTDWVVLTDAGEIGVDGSNNQLRYITKIRAADKALVFEGKQTNFAFLELLNLPLKIGTSGTKITQKVVYTPTLTPVAVAANTSAEQTFTVTGLAIGDSIVINPPGTTAGTGIVGARVSAANTLSITFSNLTAGSLTPLSGVYRVTAERS